MLRRRVATAAAEDRDLPWIYGAAMRAAADDESAAVAAATAIESDAIPAVGGDGRRRRLMAAAVRSAVATSPSAPLAALPRDEREAIALARILGMSADEIGALLGCDGREVKTRMCSGLRRLAGSRNGATPGRV